MAVLWVKNFKIYKKWKESKIIARTLALINEEPVNKLYKNDIFYIKIARKLRFEWNRWVDKKTC